MSGSRIQKYIPQIYQDPAQPGDPTSKWFADNLVEDMGGGDFHLKTLQTVEVEVNLDVLQASYVSDHITVDDMAEVEAMVGVAPLVGRQRLLINNIGDTTVYIGPTGVTPATGDPLYKDQFIVLPVGVGISVFMIRDSGSSDVVVQEFA